MPLFGRKSVSAPIMAVLEGLIILVGFVVAIEVLIILILLVNPLHPVGTYFRVTTIAEVPAAVWPTEGLVRAVPGSAGATATSEPWAFITFRPRSRLFVFVVALAALTWRACIIFVLLMLRRVLANISAAAPFPRANIRCIRLMGWAILGMAAMELLIGAGMLAYMRAAVTVADQPPVIPPAMMVAGFPWGAVLAGTAVVILAEIFRAGADLQDEQSLTV
jgi:hypothetical protein